MGKIFCIMGKSSSGKDTIFKRLAAAPELHLKKIIPYTTRPLREGEKDGFEYFFTDTENLRKLQAEGKVIEVRTYHTVYGEWHYFTVDDGQIRLDQHDYLLIGTLESYLGMCSYYGKASVVPLYIEVEDGKRLQRALDREKKEKTPRYAEMCRRFLADCEDFSEERLADVGITCRFVNESLDETEAKIRQHVLVNRSI